MNPATEQRINHVAAIELAYRQQVQRRDEQADPSGKSHRMQVNIDRIRIDPENHARDAPEQHRVAQVDTAHRVVERRDLRQLEPENYRNQRDEKPAQGPAAPISNIARRVRGGDFILINAPKVPIINNDGSGAGMKYGSVASTPCRREVR